ncbi:MAG: hypothetical protein B0W54_05320 [Cellvibrio sp. 79]|nr:MAG: hypothetical protein B0W54_05320 [Cellvibrio sp. 79]
MVINVSNPYLRYQRELKNSRDKLIMKEYEEGLRSSCIAALELLNYQEGNHPKKNSWYKNSFIKAGEN